MPKFLYVFSWFVCGVGFFLIAIGAIFTPSEISTALDVAKMRKNAIIDPPASLTGLAFISGWILAFAGGLISFDRRLWIPLIIFGGLMTFALEVSFIMVVSLALDGFDARILLALILSNLPGSILILEGLYLRFIKQRITNI